MTSRLTVGLLALLAACSALASISIHMLVPALPGIAREFESSEPMVQLTITAFLLALGAGQLVAGPACDRIGRKPVLLAGMVMFLLGSVLAAFSQNVGLLIGARILQALGGAAGLVSSRSVVSDLAAPRERVAKMAALSSVMLLSPALAPLIGGAVNAVAGWRQIFWLLGALAASCLALSAFKIGETRSRDAEIERNALRGFAILLSSRRFLRYAGATSCASAALYIFLSGSAFLLSRRYGLSSEEAGFCYALIAGSGLIGTFCAKRLEQLGDAFRCGLALIVAGAASMAIAVPLGLDHVAAFVGPMLIVGVGAGISAPAGLAGAMHAVPNLRSTGVSLAGALQMMTSGTAATLVGYLGQPTVGLLSVTILAASLLALAIAPAGAAVIGDGDELQLY